MSRPINTQYRLDEMILGLLVLLALARSSDTCTLNVLLGCMPIQFGMSPDLSFLATIQSHQLAELCGFAFQHAKACLDGYASCPPELVLYRDSLIESYSYLCTQEGQRGLPSLSCLQESANEGRTDQCRLVFQAWIATISSDGDTKHGTQTNFGQKCREITRYRACLVRTSWESCASNFSSYIARLYGESINPFLIDCDSQGEHTLGCFPGFCQNGGTCLGSGQSLQCQCPSGYRGSVCERAAASDVEEKKKDGDSNAPACSSNPCQNEGICVVTVNGPECFCRDGFSGLTCEQPKVDERCRSNPCQHGGVCIPSGETFTCQCPQGVGGTHCEDAPGLSEREKIVAIVIPVVVVVVVAVTICIYYCYQRRRKTAGRSQEETGDLDEARMQKFQSQPEKGNKIQHEPLPEPGSKTGELTPDGYIIPVPPPREDDPYYSEIRPTGP